MIILNLKMIYFKFKNDLFVILNLKMIYLLKFKNDVFKKWWFAGRCLVGFFLNLWMIYLKFKKKIMNDLFKNYLFINI